jgi:hypothetical protein
MLEPMSSNCKKPLSLEFYLRSVYVLAFAAVVILLGGCSQNGMRKAIRQNLPTADRESTVLAVYQPWFGSPEHINVGYSSDDSSVLVKQIRKAKDFGISGFVVDWYGNNRKDFDHNYAVLQGLASNEKFKVALMYDEPKGQPEDSTQEAIVALDYAYDRYIGPKADNANAYLRYNDRPVIFIWPNSQRTNWDAVRKHVNQWDVQPVLIMRFGSSSSPQDFDGFYAWVDAGEKGWAADGSNWGKSYLDGFYQKMKHDYPDKIMVTAAWPGFDDSKASWGTHRRIDERCGRTFEDTLAEFRHNQSPEHPIPFLLIETWNDYEEGTAIERGIQNCPAHAGDLKNDSQSGTSPGG